MHTSDVFEQLRNPDPARQYRDVGNERDIAHELFARAPRIASENLQFSFVRGEAKNRVQRGGLACAVGADQSEDAAFLDAKIDTVQRNGCAKHFTEPACFNTCHGLALLLFSFRGPLFRGGFQQFFCC